MPYLQVDLPLLGVPPALKRELAIRLGELYAEHMQTRAAIVNVAFRELGPDNLFRCGGPEAIPPLRPIAVVMCDGRRGRSPAQREALARVITQVVGEAIGLPSADVVVEFTQHEASEMYRNDALAPEWEPGEANKGPN